MYVVFLSVKQIPARIPDGPQTMHLEMLCTSYTPGTVMAPGGQQLCTGSQSQHRASYNAPES